MQDTIILKLRKGDQQKLNMVLNALQARTDLNIPVVLAQAGHVGASHCKIACPIITGRLMGSIGNPAKEGVFRLDANSITFGTAVKYAAKVENGTRYHPGGRGAHYMLRGVEQAVPAMVKVLSGVIRG